MSTLSVGHTMWSLRAFVLLEVLWLAVLASVSQAQSQITYYVTANGGTNGDGLTAATPFTSIASAFAPITANFAAATFASPPNNYTVVLLPGTHNIAAQITLSIPAVASNSTIGFTGGVRIMPDNNFNSTIVCTSAFPYNSTTSAFFAFRAINVANFILNSTNVRGCDRFVFQTSGSYSAIINSKFDAYQNILAAYLSPTPSSTEFTVNFNTVRQVVITDSIFSRGVVPAYTNTNSSLLGLIGAVIHQAGSIFGDLYITNTQFLNYTRYAVAAFITNNTYMENVTVLGCNRLPPSPAASDTSAVFFRSINNFQLKNAYLAQTNYAVKIYQTVGFGYLSNVTIFDSYAYNIRVEGGSGTYLFEDINFAPDSFTTITGITMSKLQILQTSNVYIRNFNITGIKHQGNGPIYVVLSNNVTFEHLYLKDSLSLKCLSIAGSQVLISDSIIDQQNMLVGGVFWENTLSTNSAAVAFGSTVTVVRTTIKNMVNSQIFVDYLSSLHFQDCNFHDNGNNTIYFANPSLIDVSGVFTTVNSNFTGNMMPLLQVHIGGDPVPNVTISGCFFDDSGRDDYAAMIHVPAGLVTVENSKFTGNPVVGSFLYAFDGGHIAISNSEFYSVTERSDIASRDSFSPICGVVGAMGPGSEINITGSSFHNIALITGAGICGKEEAVITVTDTAFNDNYARYGGAAYCDDCNMTFISTNFTRNSAYSYGGALFLTMDFFIFIENTVSFVSNNASNGGAIYGNPIEEEHGFELSIENGTLFDSNYAKVSGPVVYSASSNIPLNVTGIVSVNNTAGTVEGDSAMPPFKFVWYNESSDIVLQSSTIRFSSLNSGSLIPQIDVRVYDSQNALTAQGSGELLLVSVFIADINADPATSSASLKADLLGEVQKASLGGKVSFKQLRVVGVPGSYQVIVRSLSDQYPGTQFYLSAPLELSDCPLLEVNTTVDYSTFSVCDTCRITCLEGSCYNETHCLCPNNVIYRGGCPAFSASFTESNGIGLLVPTVAIIVVLLLTLLVVIIFREAPVIRAASPVFVCLMIVGFIIGISFLFTSLGEPSTASCMSQLWTVGFFIMIVFGSLAAKTFRVYRIFSNNKLRLESIQTSELLSWVGILMIIQAVILITWTTVSPYTPDEQTKGCVADKDPEFQNSMIGITVGYYAILLVFTAYMAWCTRKVHSAFRESTLIFFAVYNFLFTALASLVVLFVMSGNGTTFSLWTFKVVAVTYLVMSTFLILIGPKLFVLFFTKGKGKIEGPVSRGFAGFMMVGQPGQRPFTTSDLGSVSDADDAASSGDELHSSSLTSKPREIHSAKAHAVVQSGFMNLWKKRFIVVDIRLGVLLIYTDGKRIEIVDSLVLNQCVLREHSSSPDQFELVVNKGKASFRFQFKDDRKCNNILELMRPHVTRSNTNSVANKESLNSLDALAAAQSNNTLRNPASTEKLRVPLKKSSVDQGAPTPRGMASRSMEVMKSNEMTMM